MPAQLDSLHEPSCFPLVHSNGCSTLQFPFASHLHSGMSLTVLLLRREKRWWRGFEVLRDGAAATAS
eukprot:scaffold39571_cov70-Phaeocystis_antarctica.AAC.13